MLQCSNTSNAGWFGTFHTHTFIRGHVENETPLKRALYVAQGSGWGGLMDDTEHICHTYANNTTTHTNTHTCISKSHQSHITERNVNRKDTDKVIIMLI